MAQEVALTDRVYLLNNPLESMQKHSSYCSAIRLGFERMVAHYRGLLAAWADDQQPAVR